MHRLGDAYRCGHPLLGDHFWGCLTVGSTASAESWQIHSSLRRDPPFLRWCCNPRGGELMVGVLFLESSELLSAHVFDGDAYYF